MFHLFLSASAKFYRIVAFRQSKVSFLSQVVILLLSCVLYANVTSFFILLSTIYFIRKISKFTLLDKWYSSVHHYTSRALVSQIFQFPELIHYTIYLYTYIHTALAFWGSRKFLEKWNSNGILLVMISRSPFRAVKSTIQHSNS